MKLKKNFKNIFSLFVVVFFAYSCKKNIDAPPIAKLPEGNIISIDSLRKIYTSFDTLLQIDASIYATVTADEVSGNLYKTLFVQDNTNAIKLSLTNSSSKLFFQGDYVRIPLKGLLLARENNMLQLQNIDSEKQIIKQSSGNEILPKTVNITELSNGVLSPFQAQLVQINGVEFSCSDVTGTYADAINQYDLNRTLFDALGNSVIVRSSGYAKFAAKQIPSGNGSITAIVTQYNATVQLTIRNEEEVKLTGNRNAKCPVYVKNFEDQSITSGGWSTQNVLGNINWSIANIGSNSTYYTMISNYSGSNTACETWLISPAFNFTTYVNPVLSFTSAYKYTGDPLSLMITTAFTGDVTTTTWTNITSQATWSAGNFTWINSGNINLSAYQQSNVRFAFKYTGTNSNGSTWEIDDFTIDDL